MGSLALVPSGLLVFPFTVIWEEQCPRIFGSIKANSASVEPLALRSPYVRCGARENLLR